MLKCNHHYQEYKPVCNSSFLYLSWYNKVVTYAVCPAAEAAVFPSLCGLGEVDKEALLIDFLKVAQMA